MAVGPCLHTVEHLGMTSLIILLLANGIPGALGSAAEVSADGVVEEVGASSEESCVAGDISQLFEWFHAAGGTSEGVQLKNISATGRGLVAATDLAEGATVLTVPVVLTVTMQRALATPIGMQLLEAAIAGRAPDMTSFDGLLLAAWILHETAQLDSTWSTYLTSLPSSLTTPFNFTHEEVQSCLGGLSSIDYIHRGQQILEKELTLLQSLSGLESVSRDRFFQARFMSFSRTFTVDRQRLNMDSTISGLPELPTSAKSLFAETVPSNEAALFVPLADMINHANKPNCDWRYSGKRGFTITTKRPLAAGEELLISYGTKENQLWLAHYGFVEPGTPGDKWSAVLPFSALTEVDAQSSDPALQCEQEAKVEKSDLDVTLRVDAANPSSPEELEALLKSAQEAARSLGFGGACLEVVSLRLLSEAVKRQEKVFEVAEDCPPICKAYRENLRSLLATWRVFAERAIALLTGVEPPDHSWFKIPRFVRHARLYFGLWMNAHGGLKRAAKKEHKEEAKLYGSMSFFDAVYGDD